MTGEDVEKILAVIVSIIVVTSSFVVILANEEFEESKEKNLQNINVPFFIQVKK